MGINPPVHAWKNNPTLIRVQSNHIFLFLLGTENNFEITNPSFVTTQGIPYDLRSIMHYSSRAFSINGQPTIVPVDPSVNERDLGQRNGLTDLDLQHVRTLYNCEGGYYTVIITNCPSFYGRGKGVHSFLGSPTKMPSREISLFYLIGAPTGGEWSEWSRFGSCSRTCNGGMRTRTRTCVGGGDCAGSNLDSEPCGTDPCPS